MALFIFHAETRVTHEANELLLIIIIAQIHNYRVRIIIAAIVDRISDQIYQDLLQPIRVSFDVFRQNRVAVEDHQIILHDVIISFFAEPSELCLNFFSEILVDISTDLQHLISKIHLKINADFVLF